MPLPNSGMSFTPFDPLTAAELNDIVENVEALADGTGLDTGVLPEIQQITFNPVGNTDYSSTSQGTWVTMGNATVPSWATYAYIVLSIRGVYPVTGTGTFKANVKLTASGTEGYIFDSNLAVNQHVSHTIVEKITLGATGTQSLIVEAHRTSGSNAMRADASSVFQAQIIYR